jgi:hypothetical protein
MGNFGCLNKLKNKIHDNYFFIAHAKTPPPFWLYHLGKSVPPPKKETLSGALTTIIFSN